MRSEPGQLHVTQSVQHWVSQSCPPAHLGVTCQHRMLQCCCSLLATAWIAQHRLLLLTASNDCDVARLCGQDWPHACSPDAGSQAQSQLRLAWRKSAGAFKAVFKAVFKPVMLGYPTGALVQNDRLHRKLVTGWQSTNLEPCPDRLEKTISLPQKPREKVTNIRI